MKTKGENKLDKLYSFLNKKFKILKMFYYFFVNPIFRNKIGEVKLIFYPSESKRWNSAAEYENSVDGKRKGY